MSGPVAELETLLQSMLALKPPGVTGTKIQNVTALCNANIQSETVLIQRIYTHFKKTPATHKLGVLYVVDSVTRAWVEQARKAGQSLATNDHPDDGTFAAGHKRVTELLPSFMSDITSSAPDDQKARINKLVDIWERSGTFPMSMLMSFREKLAAPAKTTTPPGSPPKDFISIAENAASDTAASQASNTSNILQALAAMAKSNANNPVAQPAASNTESNSTNNMSNNSLAQGVPPIGNATPSWPGFPPQSAAGTNGQIPHGGTPNFSAFAPTMSQAQNLPFGMPSLGAQAPLPAASAAAAAAGGGMSTEQLQQQIQIITMLQAQGVPQEQWAPVIAALMAASSGGNAGAAANAAAALPPPNLPQMGMQNLNPSWNPNQFGHIQADNVRNQNGYGDPYGMRSPTGRGRRSRSRSPSGYDRRREASPGGARRRRDSPTYGVYGSTNGSRGDERVSRPGAGIGAGSGSNVYRQRSPDRHQQRGQSPRRADGSGPNSLPPPGPKNISWDSNMPPDNIKVLSRTLFVGGVTSSEDALRQIFEEYGIVQTCIVNSEKRHAFVKMLTRENAMAAKEGMDRYKGQEMQLRTRWGVGFGPRDCSNYSTGISVIPLQRLTDADRKWMLTAEYGGTGGKPLEGGMVLEEPDIEIGAGVSSKAISRRMQTDRGGFQGPRSFRDAQTGSQGDRFRQNDRDNQNGTFGNFDNNINNNMNDFGAGANALPFQFPPGFPQLPAGFQLPMMGAPGQQQPPPPGP